MLQTVGPLLMSEDKYEAGCSLGDVGCMIEEQIVRWCIDLMNFVIDALDWALKIGAFQTQDSEGKATTDWLNAIGMTEVWIGIAGVFGVMLVTIIAVTFGIVKRDRETITRALFGCALSVPLTLVSIWFVGQLVGVIELVPREILESSLGEVDMKTAVREFLIPGMNHSNAQNMQEVGEGMLAQVNRTFNPLIIWMVLGVFLLAVFFIIVINVIRNLMLQVAIATAPIAFMMLPTGYGKPMIVTWAKTIAAILLIKPIMVTWICLMLTGMLQSNGSIYGFEGFKYIFGMLLVVLVPFMVFGMFSFIGLDFDGGSREAMHSIQNLGRRVTGGSGVGRVVQPPPRTPPAPRAGTVAAAAVPAAGVAGRVATSGPQRASGGQPQAAGGGSSASSGGRRDTGPAGSTQPATPPRPSAAGSTNATPPPPNEPRAGERPAPPPPPPVTRRERRDQEQSAPPRRNDSPTDR